MLNEFRSFSICNMSKLKLARLTLCAMFLVLGVSLAASQQPDANGTSDHPSPQSQPNGTGTGQNQDLQNEPAPQNEQDQKAPVAAASITGVSPAIGMAGATVTISGSGFGQDSDGRSTVKFKNTAVKVANGNWSDTKITVSAPKLAVAYDPEQVDISVLDGNGKVLATSSAAFTEPASEWGDHDERPLDIKFVGGYEEGFQSSQASTSDAFLAIYGRRLFDHDHFGPYFAARLQTSPQASGTYNVFSVFSNPSGTITASNLNSVGAGVDLSIGVEKQFPGVDHNRTTFSLIAGTGFITPLQSNTIAATFTMPAFGTVECTELQGRLSPVLSGPNYKGIVANTAAGSASCFSNTLNANSATTPPVAPTAVTLLEYSVPDTPNFFPKYSAGLRIVNRYPGTTNGAKYCLESSPCERGYVDFTVGQSAALTGGSLRHAVLDIDTIHPLPVPNMNFLYLFGSVSKRFYHLPPSVSPLVLQTGTAATSPSNSTLIIPLTQPDRDFYRIGVGVNITQIFTALTGNSKSGQTSGQSANKNP